MLITFLFVNKLLFDKILNCFFFSLNSSDGLSELINQIALVSSEPNSTESSPTCEITTEVDTSQPDDSFQTLEPASSSDSRGRSLRNKRVHSTSPLDDSLHKIKRRTISKPRKLNPATLGQDVSEDLIRKMYTNKKMTKLKPTNLETIFEEPKPGKNETVTYVSATRFKRSITFTDHNNVPKKTVQNRRKKVKRMLGGCKIKKMSMDAFMEHLEKLREPVEAE